MRSSQKTRYAFIAFPILSMRPPRLGLLAPLTAALFLAVLLVTNSATGTNSGLLRPTPALADSCGVPPSSNSSSSTSSSSSAGSCTSSGAITAMQQAGTAGGNASSAISSASSASTTQSSRLSSLQSEYNDNCTPNSEIQAALDSAQADLTDAQNALQLANSYDGLSTQYYVSGTDDMTRQEYCRAISDFNSSTYFASKAQSAASYAACQLASAEAALDEAEALISECVKSSSSSSPNSTSSSSSNSSTSSSTTTSSSASMNSSFSSVSSY